MISAAMEQPEERGSMVGSVSGASSLSVKQREFALAYVVNGGKGTEAAVAAGYSADSAHVAASRCLVNPKVGAEIQRLCRTFVHSGLPVAINRLMQVITDPDTKPRDVIKAVNSLMDRAGMDSPRGGLQVNVGVQVNGSQAQALIGEVWNAKQARLSDIPPAMPDSPMRQLEQSIDLLASPAGDDPGGDRIEGSRPPHVSLPVHSSTTEQKPRISCECETCRAMEPGYVPDDEEPDDFAAFLKGEDDAV